MTGIKPLLNTMMKEAVPFTLHHGLHSGKRDVTMLVQPDPSVALDLRKNFLWETVGQAPCNEVEFSLLAPVREIPSGTRGFSIFIEERIFEDVGVGDHGA